MLQVTQSIYGKSNSVIKLGRGRGAFHDQLVVFGAVVLAVPEGYYYWPVQLRR